MSFRKLSVRIEGIVNLLIENTITLPELMIKFLQKIFREGGFMPAAYWLPFELKRIEFDEYDTLLNFNKERHMF